MIGICPKTPYAHYRALTYRGGIDADVESQTDLAEEEFAIPGRVVVAASGGNIPLQPHLRVPPLAPTMCQPPC